MPWRAARSRLVSSPVPAELRAAAAAAGAAMTSASTKVHPRRMKERAAAAASWGCTEKRPLSIRRAPPPKGRGLAGGALHWLRGALAVAERPLTSPSSPRIAGGRDLLRGRRRLHQAGRADHAAAPGGRLLARRVSGGGREAPGSNGRAPPRPPPAQPPPPPDPPAGPPPGPSGRTPRSPCCGPRCSASETTSTASAPSSRSAPCKGGGASRGGGGGAPPPACILPYLPAYSSDPHLPPPPTGPS